MSGAKSGPIEQPAGSVFCRFVAGADSAALRSAARFFCACSLASSSGPGFMTVMKRPFFRGPRLLHERSSSKQMSWMILRSSAVKVGGKAFSVSSEAMNSRISAVNLAAAAASLRPPSAAAGAAAAMLAS